MSEEERQILTQNFERLKEKVLIKRPVLREIIRKRGKKNVLDYAHQYVDVNLNPTIQKRQDEFLETFREEAIKRYSPEVADSAVKQLENYYFLSTADHHGPLTHPFFVNSNLLTAAACLDHKEKCKDKAENTLNNVIVLSCANIAMNNHSLPRGLLFHSFHHDRLEEHRLSFYPASVKPRTVYAVRPYGKEQLDSMYKGIRSQLDKEEIKKREYDMLKQLLDEVYNKPEVLESSCYSEQLCKTNPELWKRFFMSSGVTPPNLIYMEIESIVTQLLTKYHLNQDTVINHILFDPDYEEPINHYFENIFGSFARKEQYGTYLFWALPKGQNYNLQLWRKGNYLVSTDESYKIELHPEAIKKAMEEKELIPGMLLCYMVISFYYGLKCLGGFNQVNYLTFMKNGYIKMNVDRGNYRSIEVCARAQTKELCDGLILAFLEDPTKQIAPATGLDLYLYGNKDTWTRITDACRNVTFAEAINPLMPEIYKITYDESEWEPDLLAIGEKEASELAHLHEKIKPCIQL